MTIIPVKNVASQGKKYTWQQLNWPSVCHKSVPLHASSIKISK